MIRKVVDKLSSDANLEVPLDAMTAVVRSLNGLMKSVQMDLLIDVNITNTTGTNLTNSSVADHELGVDSESGEVKPSVNSLATTLEGGSCPTDLFGEGEELAQVMSDAINKATLKVLSKQVPGESPLEVNFSPHVPLSISLSALLTLHASRSVRAGSTCSASGARSSAASCRCRAAPASICLPAWIHPGLR
jgi:hypothetical protein